MSTQFFDVRKLAAFACELTQKVNKLYSLDELLSMVLCVDVISPRLDILDLGLIAREIYRKLGVNLFNSSLFPFRNNYVMYM